MLIRQQAFRVVVEHRGTEEGGSHVTRNKRSRFVVNHDGSQTGSSMIRPTNHRKKMYSSFSIIGRSLRMLYSTCNSKRAEQPLG